jgi:AraC family transcriptional regulator, L-rhamnose operon regulatory protein RhaS
MRRYVQYDSFNIYCFEVSEWPHPVHKHSYFEIIFIQRGKGKHILNGNSFPYAANDVFLLGPEDYHSFEIEDPTAFAYIRFTEVFVKGLNAPKYKSWQTIIDSLFHTSYQVCGSLVNDVREKTVLQQLLDVLIYEYNNRQEESYEVIMDSMMRAMLTILSRNINKQLQPVAPEQKTAPLIEQIIIYLRQHILQPDLLRIEHLAEQFHYSPSYLSIYFKKQVGEPLQQYILKYRLKLVADRLQYSNMSISEITYEFGFTDESHLHKLFKKYYGVSPSDYRKNQSRDLSVL